MSRFDRRQVEAFIEVAVDLLDVLDADPDVEPNGDERDGDCSEDEFMQHSRYVPGPGCPISDPDSAVDDRACDEINQDLEPDYEI